MRRSPERSNSRRCRVAPLPLSDPPNIGKLFRAPQRLRCATEAVDGLFDNLGEVSVVTIVVLDQLCLEPESGCAPLVLLRDPRDAVTAASRRTQSADSSRTPSTARARRVRGISRIVCIESDMRSSTVPKPGCGRMSHQSSRTDDRPTFDEHIHECLNSSHPDSSGGVVRRHRLKDLRARRVQTVARPCQNGLDADTR